MFDKLYKYTYYVYYIKHYFNFTLIASWSNFPIILPQMICKKFSLKLSNRFDRSEKILCLFQLIWHRKRYLNFPINFDDSTTSILCKKFCYLYVRGAYAKLLGGL